MIAFAAFDSEEKNNKFWMCCSVSEWWVLNESQVTIHLIKQLEAYKQQKKRS